MNVMWCFYNTADGDTMMKIMLSHSSYRDNANILVHKTVGCLLLKVHMALSIVWQDTLKCVKANCNADVSILWLCVQILV